jgi:hypothetical protein
MDFVGPRFRQIPGAFVMTDAECREVFNDFCRHPPKSPLWYLIGPMDMLEEDKRPSPLLSAGPWMRSRLVRDIDGISTSYLYISCPEEMTATSMHFEDCAWLSANVLLCGKPKLWLCVEPDSNTVLIAALEAMYAGRIRDCSQKVRHLDTLIPRTLLDQWGVKYHIKACYPGEIIFTMPGAYHQIINMGANMAEAINFVLEDTVTFPPEYVFCHTKHCQKVSPISLRDSVVYQPKKRRVSDEHNAEALKKARWEEHDLEDHTLGNTTDGGAVAHSS